MQVRREVEKIKGEAGPDPPAASSLLRLATVATMARPALRTISTNQMVAPVIAVSGIDASILPSPERRMKENVSPSANWKAEREEEQGHIRPGSWACDHSRC